MNILKIKQLLIKLIHLNDSPEGIALGVAFGVFIGMTPLYGFHTLMTVCVALLVRRTNKVAILVGTNISLPPTLPFITWGGYETGRLVLHRGYPPLSWKYFSHISFSNLKDFYFPLFIGSIILGIILAVIFYFITLDVVRKYKQKKAQQNAQKNF